MNKTLVVLVLSLLYGTVAMALSNVDVLPGENLYAYQARMEAYFAPQIASRGLAALGAEEGGEYSEYLKTMRFWEPRLRPHGDFERYYLAANNFYNVYSKRRHRAVTHSAVAAAGTIQNTAPWRELGPYLQPSGTSAAGTGPIEFLTFYGPNSVHMLCGSTAGGLFYSQNGGANWSSTGTDTQIKTAGVSSAVFHPTDERTWFVASSGDSDHNDAQPIGYIGGVFRTADAGVTWSQIAAHPQLGGINTRINQLLIDPTDPDELWAATSDGLFVTHNAMALAKNVQWTLVEAGFVYDIEMRPGNSQWLYATVRSGNWRLIFSNDGGNVWSDVPNAPSTAGISSETIEVTPAKPDSLYVLLGMNGCGSQLFIYEFASSTAKLAIGNACITMGGGHAFGVDPINPNEIFLSSGIRGLRWLYNGTGSTYSSLGNTFHDDLEDLVPHPTRPNEVWMCHHGGVSVSTDNGATWATRNTGLGVSVVMGMATSASDPDYLALGLYHAGTVVTATSDLGTGWKNPFGGDGMRPMIAPSTPQYMWASAVSSVNIWRRSTNYGQSFGSDSTDSPQWSIRASAFNRVSPSTQFRIASSHKIIRTTNWGVTWPDTISDFDAIYPGATIGTLYSAETNGDYLIAEVYGNGKSRLFRTKKANDVAANVIASWEELPLPTNLGISDVDFDPDPNIVYLTHQSSASGPNAVIGSGIIYKIDYTTPAPCTPANCRDLTQNLPSASTGADALAVHRDGSGGIYYVSDFGCFYSNDATRATGSGWTLLGANLPHTTFNGLELNYVSQEVRVASRGRGAWEHDLVATITGILFNDQNGDGIRDTDELPLSNWTVTLTDANGATATVTTDVNGQYTFSGLAAGSYSVAEIVQSGWTPTTNSTKTVQVTKGATSTGNDFGNEIAARKVCLPPPSGMTASWTFNEPSGGNAHDNAGYDDVGSHFGAPTIITGMVGRARHFNGMTQQMQVPSTNELNVGTGDFSIDAWVRTSSNGLRPIVDKRTAAPIGYSFFIFDGRLAFQMADRPGPSSCSTNNSQASCTNWFSPSSSTVADGQWHHVAVSVDRDNSSGGLLYVDGVIVLTFDPTVRNLSLDNNAQLVVALVNNFDRWDGDLDEIALYKRALTSFEVQSIHKAGTYGRCGGVYTCNPQCEVNRTHGGKVVFSSNRVQKQQLFVQSVDAEFPRRQVTSDFFGARSPKWSRDGKYIVYITEDVIVGGGSGNVDELVVTDDSGSSPRLLSIHAPSFSAKTLGYPQFSDDGKSIVVLFADFSGRRGIGLIHAAPPFFVPAMVTLVQPDPNLNLNPGEPVFSLDGQFVYFGADTATQSSVLHRVPISGGTPTPVLDSSGALVRRFFAPSLSPDGTRLMFNSEMYREDSSFLDEEIVELDLINFTLKRITTEVGNQYGFFAKNGAGEYLLQSSNPPSAPNELFLQQPGMPRVPFDTGDANNLWHESGDWWKPPCIGGSVLWRNGEAVGCKFPTFGAEEKSLCGSWARLPSIPGSGCSACLETASIGQTLKEGEDVATAQPADLSCLNQ